MTGISMQHSWKELRALLLEYEDAEARCTCGTLTGVHDISCTAIQSPADLQGNPVVLNTISLRPPPVGRQYGLGIQLMQHVDHLHPHSGWIELLPTRLGYDAHTDLAALALAESLEFHFGGRKDEFHSKASFLCYDKAVSYLRNFIESTARDGFDEATLITVALLAVCEVMMNPHSTTRRRNVFVHWSGLQSVFLTKFQPSQVSDIGTAILSNLWDCNFGVACATGTPSPFEQDAWMQLKPMAFRGMTTHAFTLRRISNLFFIRSPRLIAYVRSLRQGEGIIDPKLTRKTATLASDIYSYQDDDAESALLHRVKVTMTKDPSSRRVVPYSYSFLDIEDFNALVLYWSMRQFLINLLLVVNDLAPSLIFHLNRTELCKMKKEKQRCTTNLMMSWEFAESTGPFATIWVAKGLLQNWLELRRTTMFKKLPTDLVRAWMAPRMNHPFNEWLSENANEAQWDVAADVLVGGPLVGFIAHTGSQTM